MIFEIQFRAYVFSMHIERKETEIRKSAKT